jgi:hypothetical protein
VAWQRQQQRPPGGHGYDPRLVCLFLRLVLVANVSLRGASRVLATVRGVLGMPQLPVPDWTTGRLWLLRLGHAVLTARLEQAEDWAWLIDHSVQIGPDKCLVILGIRLRDLPPPGQCLRHEDLRLVALTLADRWTRADVDAALETATARTGVPPRVIVDDHGVDLFRQRHPQTAEVYDAKHKAACLLKRRLASDPRWRAFQAMVGQTRCAVQQTELAFLTPPAPRPKARFMNLGRLLAWATRVLAILRSSSSSSSSSSVTGRVRPERLAEKLGWAREFADELTRWSQWQEVIDVTVTLINQQGLHHGTADLLAQRLAQLDAHGDAARHLAAELVGFVRGQQAQARPGERFPGSTEVLESCFGRFKQLEKQQSRGGFTQLLLGFGALLARTTIATVREAMHHSRTADVREWARETLGTTLFAQRKLAFAGATETG